MMLMLMLLLLLVCCFDVVEVDFYVIDFYCSLFLLLLLPFQSTVLLLPALLFVSVAVDDNVAVVFSFC